MRSGSCLPLGPHTAVTSASISCGHHLQPGTDRQGEQPLAQVGGDLLHRDAHLLGHGGAVVSDAVVWYFLVTAVPFLGSSWRTPETYHRQVSAGDRHLKFHELRDNLCRVPQGRCRLGRLSVAKTRIWA